MIKEDALSMARPQVEKAMPVIEYTIKVITAKLDLKNDPG